MSWTRKTSPLAVMLPILIFLSGPAFAEPEKSQLDVSRSLQKSDAPNAFRALFIGDSITLHGTSAKLKAKLGWDHVAGMAASEESRDYAHVLAGLVQNQMPDRKVDIYFHTLGGSGAVAERLSAIEKVRPLEPHLVFVQLGEHEKDRSGLDKLRADLAALVTAFNAQNPPPRVICAGPWSPPPASGKSSYEGWAGEVEKAMQEVCTQNNIPFISVRDLAEDPACRGWGESDGVKWHPNDKGHDGYARKFFGAWQSLQAEVAQSSR